MRFAEFSERRSPGKRDATAMQAWGGSSGTSRCRGNARRFDWCVRGTGIEQRALGGGKFVLGLGLGIGMGLGIGVGVPALSSERWDEESSYLG
jgi:hypothetical protein